MLAVVAVAVAISSAPVALAAPAADSGPAAMPDRPDLQAAHLFQSGKYADALAIYQRLYAETHHPTYLRNIGRCHQMLRQPQPAIESFQAYRREARNLEAGERAEIDGYIAEMRRLEVGAPPRASAPPAGAPSWSPASAAPTSVSSSGSSGTSSTSGGVLHRWWFWTGLGVLVATSVIVAVAAGSGKDRLPCPSGAVCPP